MAERSIEMALPTVMMGCAISARVYREFFTFATPKLGACGGGGEKLAGECEANVFLNNFKVFYGCATGFQIGHDIFHEVIRSRSAGRETDALHGRQPLRLNFRSVID